MDVDYALQHVPRMPLYSSFERKITQQIEGEKMILNELDEKAKLKRAGGLNSIIKGLNENNLETSQKTMELW